MVEPAAIRAPLTGNKLPVHEGVEDGGGITGVSFLQACKKTKSKSGKNFKNFISNFETSKYKESMSKKNPSYKFVWVAILIDYLVQ